MAINRTLVTWSRNIHAYLSIALLLVLIFFSITGITLNHAANMTAIPETTTLTLDSLPELPKDENGQIADSPELAAFVRREFGVRLSQAEQIREGDFLLIDYAAPGKTTYIEIDQGLNEAFAETTDYGLVAVLNDLHKVRDTTVLWSWLVDISAVLLVIFTLAGFVLLLPNKFRFKRVAKYSAIGLGLVGIGYFLGTL